MKFNFKAVLLASCVLLGTACSQKIVRESQVLPVQTVVGKNQVQGQILGKLGSDSKFAKLEIGMSKLEVEALIGAPADVSVQASGTAWVPYYFGSDTWRTESYYQNHGRLVFNADGYLVLIDAIDNLRR